MTRNDDIERVLELWLAEGPRHMSDHLFDGTLERIDRLPRGRLADLKSRLHVMNLNVRVASAVAVIIAVAGAGFIMNGVPGVGGEPSPTPFRDSSATVAALQSLWEAVGDRQSPGDWGVDDDSFNIDSSGLRIEQVHGDVLSSLSLTEAGSRLVLTFQHGITTGFGNTNQQWRCQVGDQGTYTVRLTPDGRTLTLGLISDPCVPRAAFLPGDWTRSVCQSGYYACMPAGAAVAAPAELDPKLAADLTATWASVGGRPVPGAESDTPIGFAFEPTSLSMNGFKGWVASDWSVLSNGSLVLRLNEPQESLTSQHWGCQTGDRGSYHVALAADRNTLTLTLEADACQIRARILPGAWLRCPLTDGGCPGWAEHPARLEPSPGASAEGDLAP
jgi:hypothetical protein